MNWMRLVLTMMLLLTLVVTYAHCEAASIINISAQPGSNVYSVTATDLQESAGIDLAIFYDTATLSAPQVKSGTLTEGAIMVPNTATPGFVRIGFITGGVLKGSGELATITFVKNGVVVQQPTILSVSVYSASGSQLAAQATSGSQQASVLEPKSVDSGTKNSSVPATGTTPGVSGSVAVPGASSGSTTAAVVQTQSTTTSISTLGTVSQSTETITNNETSREVIRKEERFDDTSYQNATSRTELALKERDTTERKGATVQTPTISVKSVLDVFAAYSDARTVKRLSALFDRKTMQDYGITQTPAVVVSDGKSLMTVAVELANETDSPSFSLKGANQKAIRRVSVKKWELDALPHKGKTDVRLTVNVKGERTIVIPLVVVPPLTQNQAQKMAAFSVSDFDKLLAKPLINGKPAYDLNADDKQDYVDDYILVAHWLIKQQRSVKGVGQKPAVTYK